MPARRLALQHRGLAHRHHHVHRVLSEVIAENWKTHRKARRVTGVEFNDVWPRSDTTFRTFAHAFKWGFYREEASISVTDCGTNSFHRWECDVTNCMLIFRDHASSFLYFAVFLPFFLVPRTAIKCTKPQTDLHFCKQRHY